jgi:hypothetical protein
MATTRQDILTVIKSTIEGIVASNDVRRFKSVILGRMPPSNTQNVPYPTCFIYSDRETRIDEGIEAVIGMETWSWMVVLEVWASDAIMESLLNDIHTAMYTNRYFSNHACYSERVGIDFLIVDASNQITAMLVPYRIVYRHKLGDMGDDDGDALLEPSSFTNRILLPGS